MRKPLENLGNGSGTTEISLDKRGLSPKYEGPDCCCRLCEPIQARVSGLSPARRVARLITMLQVFVDESGRGQSNAAYVAAGFVASVENWLKFGHAWQNELDRDPPIQTLKARLPMHLHDTERLMRFVEIIRDNGLMRTRIAIPHKHYTKIFKGKVSKKFDNPFWVPTYSIIMVTLGWLAGRGVTEKVNFIFDTVKRREEEFIISAWDFYKTGAARITKPLIGAPPTFADTEEDVLPLQAADLYAWNARQDSVERARGRERTHPVWEVLESLPGAQREWSATDLKGVFDMIPRTAEQRREVARLIKAGS